VFSPPWDTKSQKLLGRATRADCRENAIEAETIHA
jgi:hypothetical protein